MATPVTEDAGTHWDLSACEVVETWRIDDAELGERWWSEFSIYMYYQIPVPLDDEYTCGYVTGDIDWPIMTQSSSRPLSYPRSQWLDWMPPPDERFELLPQSRWKDADDWTDVLIATYTFARRWAAKNAPWDSYVSRIKQIQRRQRLINPKYTTSMREFGGNLWDCHPVLRPRLARFPKMPCTVTVKLPAIEDTNFTYGTIEVTLDLRLTYNTEAAQTFSFTDLVEGRLDGEREPINTEGRWDAILIELYKRSARSFAFGTMHALIRRLYSLLSRERTPRGFCKHARILLYEPEMMRWMADLADAYPTLRNRHPLSLLQVRPPPHIYIAQGQLVKLVYPFDGTRSVAQNVIGFSEFSKERMEAGPFEPICPCEPDYEEPEEELRSHPEIFRTLMTFF